MCGKCQSVLAQKHLQYELDVERSVIEPIQEILDVSLPGSSAQIILNTRSNIKLILYKYGKLSLAEIFGQKWSLDDLLQKGLKRIWSVRKYGH